MPTTGLKVSEIKKNLSLLPEDKLDEMKDSPSFERFAQGADEAAPSAAAADRRI